MARPSSSSLDLLLKKCATKDRRDKEHGDGDLCRQHEAVSTEGAHTFENSGRDHQRLALQSRLWHIEAARDEPLAGAREAHAHEEQHGSGRIAGQSRGALDDDRQSGSSPPFHPSGQRHRRAHDWPSLVACEAGRDDGPSCRSWHWHLV